MVFSSFLRLLTHRCQHWGHVLKLTSWFDLWPPRARENQLGQNWGVHINLNDEQEQLVESSNWWVYDHQVRAMKCLCPFLKTIMRQWSTPVKEHLIHHRFVQATGGRKLLRKALCYSNQRFSLVIHFSMQGPRVPPTHLLLVPPIYYQP